MEEARHLPHTCTTQEDQREDLCPSFLLTVKAMFGERPKELFIMSINTNLFVFVSFVF